MRGQAAPPGLEVLAAAGGEGTRDAVTFLVPASVTAADAFEAAWRPLRTGRVPVGLHVPA